MTNRKNRRKLAFRVILAAVVVYLLLLLSTIGFLRDFKNCVLGNTEGIDERNRLLRYEIGEDIVYDSVEIRIVPIFAVYGLKHGFVAVHYSVHATYNGETAYYSCETFPFHLSKWKLKRIDGEWMVVDIEEDP